MGKSHELARLVVAAAIAVSCAGAEANLIVNGGFETPVLVPVGSDPLYQYQHLNGSELTGWKSFSTYKGTVLFNSLYSPVTEGEQAVQLEVPGDSISQTFLTVIGQTYLLSFDLSAFGVGYGFVSTLGVTIGSATSTFNGSYLDYVAESVQFVADSAFTTLTFVNAGPSFTYPHLDHVTVVAVPEPATWWLLPAGLGVIRAMRRRTRPANTSAWGKRSRTHSSLILEHSNASKQSTY